MWPSSSNCIKRESLFTPRSTIARSRRCENRNSEQLEANIQTQEARYQAGTTERDSLTAARLQAHELGPKIETARRDYDGALLDLAEAMGTSLGVGVPLPQPEGELRFARHA